jgi:cytochrome c
MRTRYLNSFCRLQRSLCLPLVTVVTLAGCEGGRSEYGQVVVQGGEPDRGARIIKEVGCGACHMIPGIGGAEGVVGPPLTAWADRSFIAGHLPNEPDNLVRWIMDAPSVEPKTAMPDLDLTSEQARDVAAYLYTLD